MSYLFSRDIHDWSTWGKVFQSIETFEPIVHYIYEKEYLPYEKPENLKPGTNAVLKVGNTVCKIFAPKESGMDPQSDYHTELFGLNRADSLCISIPKVLANGCVHDKYDFLYLVLEFIDSKALGDVEHNLSDSEKEGIGRKLRVITNKLNTPCERFNNWDVTEREFCNKRWSCLPDSFNKERLGFLKKYKTDQKVYVHGDLNPDNVLIDEDKNLHIIDFADAILAPAEYELAAIICELFCFEEPYMRGFFGADFNITKLVQKCFEGIIIHDFGANIIRCNFGSLDTITSLDILKERIYTAIKNGKRFEDE